MFVDRDPDWGEGMERKERQSHYVVLGKVPFFDVSTGATTQASAVDSPSQSRQPRYFDHHDENTKTFSVFISL